MVRKIAIVSPHSTDVKIVIDLIVRNLGGLITSEDIEYFSDSSELPDDPFQVYIVDDFAGGFREVGKMWQPQVAEIRKRDPNARIILDSAMDEDEVLAKKEGIVFCKIDSVVFLCALIKKYL